MTKALTKYDYTVIKLGLGKVVGIEQERELQKIEANEQSKELEDFEITDSGDENIENTERKPREEAYNTSKKVTMNSLSDVSRDEKPESLQAMKKIVDCEDFTGSVADDEDYMNFVRQRSYREETKDQRFEIKDFWRVGAENTGKSKLGAQGKNRDWSPIQQPVRVFKAEGNQRNKVKEVTTEEDWYSLLDDSPGVREVKMNLKREVKGSSDKERQKREDSTFYQLYNEIVQDREKGLQWNL